MAFWSNSTLDPKRQYKFRVTFDYLNGPGGGTDSTFLAQYADRPVYQIADGAKVNYLDKEFAFPGKITWTPVKIRFVDAYDSVNGGVVNVSKASYDYLAGAGWVAPPAAGPQIGANQMATISKGKSVARTGDVRIDVLNSEGQPIDRWTIKNAFVTTVALNALDYGADAILTAEYSFRYDWAELA